MFKYVFEIKTKLKKNVLLVFKGITLYNVDNYSKLL